MQIALKFFDIHTHHTNKQNSVFNVLANELVLPNEDNISIGIHPCYLENIQLQKDFFYSYCTTKTVKAIGEIGLDSFSKYELAVQIPIFLLQLKKANELQKPLIIHAVKTHAIILELLKKNKNNSAVLFHGFNQNINLFNLVNDANHYISFGAALQNNKSNAALALKKISLKKVLLETDSSKYSIEEIYSFASTILNKNIDHLIEIIQENTLRFLNNE
jgi:TatD DNase family protein